MEPLLGDKPLASTAATASSILGPALNDPIELRNLIKEKEQELHAINELRVQQTEQMLMVGRNHCFVRASPKELPMFFD